MWVKSSTTSEKRAYRPPGCFTIRQAMIRDYTPEDGYELRKVHENSGLSYQFPNLDNPLFFVKKVLEVEGRAHSALVLKGCAESYLLLGNGEPRARFDAMGMLQDAVLKEAWAKGLDEIHACVPEKVKFDKRLKQLGWSRDRDGWHLWSRSTK